MKASPPTPRLPSPGLPERIARLRGVRPPFRWESVHGGYTRAERWVVAFEDGSSVFVKAATDDATAGWLRQEHRIYSSLSGDFMPELLGWEDGDRPVLLLEDLSGGHWPPPWDREKVDAVLAMLARLRSSPAPPHLPALAENWKGLVSWPRVAEDPQPFLNLGLCSPEWLDRHLPALIAAEAAARLDGGDLLHLDVRSDNLCFHNGRVKLVDWNWACVGNGAIDIAGWLPSLCCEGGPAPETVLRGEGRSPRCWRATGRGRRLSRPTIPAHRCGRSRSASSGSSSRGRRGNSACPNRTPDELLHLLGVSC
jgi:hypothetical protein